MGLQTNHNHAPNGYRFFPAPSIPPSTYNAILKCLWESLFPKITLNPLQFFFVQESPPQSMINHHKSIKVERKNIYQQPCPVGFIRSSLLWPYIFVLLSPQALASQWEGSCMVEGQHLGKCSGGSPDQNRRHWAMTWLPSLMRWWVLVLFFFGGEGVDPKNFN